MSVSMFALFCSLSALVLGLIIVFREPLIDFEDAIWADVKKAFRTAVGRKEQEV